tara:strand:- start:119 stop:595 length:477 start_codon:yes stop_codon:yes gene_type:complete
MSLSPELRDSYLSMFRDIHPDIAVTLKTRPDSGLRQQAMLKLLTRCDARVARVSLGRNWCRKPQSERFQGVFVLEYGRMGISPHWHGLVRSPDGDTERFRWLIKNAWEGLRWPAWTQTDPVVLEKYSEKATYILKELHDDSVDRVVFTNMLRGNEAQD